jgi:hypothetical protein
MMFFFKDRYFFVKIKNAIFVGQFKQTQLKLILLITVQKSKAMKNKQLNLYLTPTDLSFIEKYLTENGFLFAQTYQEGEKIIYDEVLMRENEIQKILLLPSSKTLLQKFGKHWKSLAEDSEIIEFTVFGMRDGVLRVRFFYSPAALTAEGCAEKSENFLKKADVFFRWLRRNFVKYPSMPNFYRAKNIELKEAF